LFNLIPEKLGGAHPQGSGLNPFLGGFDVWIESND